MDSAYWARPKPFYFVSDASRRRLSEKERPTFDMPPEKPKLGREGATTSNVG